MAGCLIPEHLHPGPAGWVGDGFDGVPGLYCKAFLIAERARHGSNRYAPFYLWRDGAAMTDFLLSAAFRAVGLKFGRPMVRSWDEIDFIAGPAANETPRVATWEAAVIEPDTDLAVAAAGQLISNTAKGEAGTKLVEDAISQVKSKLN